MADGRMAGAVRSGQERVSPQSWLPLVVQSLALALEPAGTVQRHLLAILSVQWELWLSRVVMVDVADGDCTRASCIQRRMRHTA